MKKGVIIAIAVVTVLALYAIVVYNSMVSKNEAVNAAWAKVENQYQRRADLIPNLVNTVKGYAKHETETLEAVVKARSAATSISIDPENMTAEQLKDFQKAQNEVGSAIGRLIAISEAYPDLKANENFKELQTQLEGTENRIATARMDFTNSVNDFNAYILRFPNNFFAGMFGFSKKEQFAAEEGANKAPEVKF